MNQIDKKRHAELSALRSKIIDLITEANILIVDHNAQLDNVVAELSAYEDERTERWRDSDRGADHEQWVSKIEDGRIDEILEPDDFKDTVPRELGK
ncbi:MAG: hypothetical protein JRD89_09070 [Deltaproteobacteria bacterium]|nr:hypothetical protein [Deltaproteobacteria bacterium]